MRYEIGIAGSGGQGVVIMGQILSQAAASIEKLYIAQIRSYDPAVRGGRAEANLVISDEEIDYPGVLRLDILLALSQNGYERNVAKLGKGALLIVDSELVEEVAWEKTAGIPFTRIAREQFNTEQVTNMVALGTIAGLCEHIPVSEVETSISGIFKDKALELNLSAFRQGMEQAEKIQESGYESMESATDVDIEM